MEDELLKNKHPVKSAIGLIKVLRRVDKVKEEEAKKLGPELEAFKTSDKYAKLLDELKKRDDDDDFKVDADPEGYELYESIVCIF
jgi:hypothetical protein